MTTLPLITRAQAAPAPANSAQPQLTPEQKRQGQERFNAYGRAMDALRADKKLTPAQKQAKAKALGAALDKDELAILTPAQRARVLKQRQMVAAQSKAFVKQHQSQIAQSQQLDKRLKSSLTAAQTKKIEAVQTDAKAQLTHLAQDKTTDNAAKQKKAMAIQQDALNKTLALLTPAQRTDFKKLQAIQQRLQADLLAVNKKMQQK